MKEYDLLSDNQLITMYVSGDNSAFECLLNRHKDKVFRHIVNLVKDDDVANDIFQETFIKIVMCIRDGRYEDKGKFVAWALRIAHNLTIDHFRRLTSENLVSHDDETNNIEGKMSIVEGSVQDVLVYEDTLKQVERLMYALPMAQQEIVYMRFYQDMSFKEISEVLNISINTALGRMRYAVINLKKMADKHLYFN